MVIQKHRRKREESEESSDVCACERQRLRMEKREERRTRSRYHKASSVGHENKNEKRFEWKTLDGARVGRQQS